MSHFVKVPEWELESGFDPRQVEVRKCPAWVTVKGEIPSPAVRVAKCEEVLKNDVDFDINALPLCDPNYLLMANYTIV